MEPEKTIMPDNFSKLGPSLKMQMLDDSSEGTSMLNLLIQIDSSATTTIHEQLDNLSAEVRTEAGDILTISLPADQLDNLANLDSVILIELSSPLSTE